jgi:hypothetical protein
MSTFEFGLESIKHAVHVDGLNRTISKSISTCEVCLMTIQRGNIILFDKSRNGLRMILSWFMMSIVIDLLLILLSVKFILLCSYVLIVDRSHYFYF